MATSVIRPCEDTVRNFRYFEATTKDAISEYLNGIYGYNYVVFATLYSMTDGTDGGYYVIWRQGNMSHTVKFIKLQ